MKFPGILFLLLIPLITIEIDSQDDKTGMINDGGRVSENGIVESKILTEKMRFSIYLPPGYDTSERNYPVVYLLHGRTDDHTAWIQFGEMQRITDEAILSGKIAPMIIVMPDAKLTFFMNDISGSYRYEDYFIKELLPFIEKNYRCRTKKEYRGIAGLSMGGFGALLYSLKYPDLFTACSAMSSAVRTDEEIINLSNEYYSEVYAPVFGNFKDSSLRISDFYKDNSILNLVRYMPESHKGAVRFYIDCGDGDHLAKGNAALHTLMIDLKIPHEYRVRDGIHEWEYWRTGLADALAFISRDFHR